MSASLRERVMEQIEPSVAATVSREVLRRQIEEIIHEIANKDRLELSGREQLQLADELADDMTGYGPLRPLLLDDSINDVMVNGPSQRLCRATTASWSGSRSGSATTITSPRWRRRLPARVGRRIDESSPMVDCRLPDGSRVNIIFPPLALHSPCISIRKFPSHRLRYRGHDRKRHHDSGHRALAGDCRPVPAQCAGLRRHRFRQDHAAQRHEPVHRPQRAHRHHRGCGGIAASAAARDHPGDPASQSRRHRAGDPTRSGVERAPHASGPDHRRRGARRRSVRHAAGDEHRS